MSETGNQGNIREHFHMRGYRLWRNNVGALLDKRGIPIRYGLANDDAQLNSQLKSADLIGWVPVLITPDMIGQCFARFVSIEAKPNGWTFPNPTNKAAYAHAAAQRRWAEMVVADGGEAGFMIDPVRGFEPRG